MTVIRLVTKDQELIIAEKPLLASGDVNSVVLHVDFDAAWDRYIARTAVFYTSKDSTVYEKLLTNGECIIPDEVLTETGTLFVGVRAVPVDGTAQKTSALVKYKIVEGAKPGTYTLHVTPDLYQQYIEAIKGQCDPITAQMQSDFADQMDAWGADVARLLSGYLETQSYIGKAEKSRTLTFNFEPRVVIISKDTQSATGDTECAVAIRGQSFVGAYDGYSGHYSSAELIWEGNTLLINNSGQSSSNAGVLNGNGATYYVAAFA